MRFHHVNLAVHPDLLDDEIEFLVNGLGLERLDPGPELANLARWFGFPEGVQVHLSRTAEPYDEGPGHVAVVVGDELDALDAHLVEAGLKPVRQDRLPAVSIVTDPAGHVWELRSEY
jgi:catechol 2,3-dioxygenase-like lactoylglutathione lyase family enzyme